MKHIPNDKSISCVSEGLGEAQLLKNLITQQILMKYNTGILMKYSPGCDRVTIAKETMQFPYFSITWDFTALAALLYWGVPPRSLVHTQFSIALS